MVHPVGIEPATFWSVARRSIQLSYGCQPSRSCPATPLIYTVKMECQMQSAKNNEKVSSSGSNPLIKKTSDLIILSEIFPFSEKVLCQISAVIRTVFGFRESLIVAGLASVCTAVYTVLTENGVRGSGKSGRIRLSSSAGRNSKAEIENRGHQWKRAMISRTIGRVGKSHQSSGRAIASLINPQTISPKEGGNLSSSSSFIFFSLVLNKYKTVYAKCK